MIINFKIIEKFAYIMPSELRSGFKHSACRDDFVWRDRKLSVPLYQCQFVFTDVNRIKRGKYSIRSKKSSNELLTFYKGRFQFTNVNSIKDDSTWSSYAKVSMKCREFQSVSTLWSWLL